MTVPVNEENQFKPEATVEPVKFERACTSGGKRRLLRGGGRF